MSSYLKSLTDSISSSKRRRGNQTQNINSLVETLTKTITEPSRPMAGGLLAQRAAALAAPKVAPQAAAPQTPAKGHHAGDGHNHAAGSVPTEKEAEELWNRLQKMLKDSPHKITPGARSRSYATQVALWNRYKAGKGPQAARPGTSKHGNGRANDLQYSSAAARAWALQNAAKYGLAFPIYNPKLPRHLDESWHIELAKSRK